MYGERPSQRAIAPGPGRPAEGSRTAARRQIEALLGSHVYLDLRIKVAKDWQRDPRQLRRLGFYDDVSGPTAGRIASRPLPRTSAAESAPSRHLPLLRASSAPNCRPR